MVAPGFVVDARGPAKLPDGQNQTAGEQAALVQIIEQSGHGLIQPGGVAVLHDLEVAVVLVPAAVAGVLFRFDMVAPVDLDEGNTRFDESAGQEAGLAEAGPAIAIRQGRRFAGEVEGRPALRRQKHVQHPLLIGGQVLLAGQPVRLPLHTVEGLEQLLAVMETFRRQLRGQAQSGNARRTLHRVILQAEGVPGRPQHAAPFPDDRFFPLMQLAADDEKRMEGLTPACRSHPRHHRPQRRLRRTRQWLAIQTHAARSAARQANRSRDAMIVGKGRQRANNRQAVTACCQLREQFRKTDAADPRGDGSKRAAIFRRCLRLGVEGVELARPTPEPEQNDRAGRP